MSFFQNFFGKRRKPERQTAPRPITLAKLPPIKPSPAKPESIDPANDKNLIRAFDNYGREMFITKEKWRTDVLPSSIKSNWDKPDQLYGIIFNSLNDGFRSDLIAAAQQLYKIDTQHDRGACVWGIVLMEEGRLNEAEKIFRDFIAKYGENGSILTNLAKVYARRKDNSKAEVILWHALEIDPNQNNGMGWYEVIHRERGGEEAGQAALHRIAALPSSWRAQLWLARFALKSKNLEQAIAYYQESLAHAGKDVPIDLLAQMSGDLGNHAHLPELLQLTEPRFVAQTHGLQVGNNLIKAYLDLGQIEAARRIVNQLYALKRPEWNQTLSFWDKEIAKVQLATSSTEEKTQLQMAMLTIEGPVWLKPLSPAAELFPSKSNDGLSVCFFGSSAETATNSKRVQHQLSDAVGRMSRALPLFLAEQIDFGSNARVQTLIPWITEEIGGFILSGVIWRDEDAANYARQSAHKSDYVVIIHLKTQTEPWTVELRLIRTIDGNFLGNFDALIPSAKPEETIPQLAQNLLALLVKHAEIESQVPPVIYRAPTGKNFQYYLLRLEQLLAVRCAGMDGVRPNFLSGEREIIDGNLQLCLAYPDNVITRLLLVQTMLGMKKVRPDILPEFKDKLSLLQNEKPLAEPANSMIRRMLNEVV
jgi:tetratricopeptide (TPR) repeat protein